MNVGRVWQSVWQTNIVAYPQWVAGQVTKLKQSVASAHRGSPCQNVKNL